MFGKLKYIVDEDGNFMIFSPAVYHKTAYRSMVQHTSAACVGAGFITADGGKIRCHGRSESLNIASRDMEDTEILAYGLGLEAAP